MENSSLTKKKFSNEKTALLDINNIIILDSELLREIIRIIELL